MDNCLCNIWCVLASAACAAVGGLHLRRRPGSSYSTDIYNRIRHPSSIRSCASGILDVTRSWIRAVVQPLVVFALKMLAVIRSARLLRY